MSDPGSAPQIQVEPLENGRYLVVQDGRQRLGFAARSKDGVWIFLDGETYFIRDAADTPRRASRLDDEHAVAAPMPATVVSVNVTPGQQVTKGDVVIMLEAMKMELPIRAPSDGRVAGIACQAGELVQPGVPLLTIE